MLLFRSLLLLLTLVAPTAFAEGLYQVEILLFRQNGEPASTRQRVPENWDNGAQKIDSGNERSPALNDLAGKLQGSGNYQVLMQRAWQQSIGTEPGKMAERNSGISPSRAPSVWRWHALPILMHNSGSISWTRTALSSAVSD